MNLNLLYVHSDTMGYGRLGVQLAASLSALGVEVFDDLPEPGRFQFEQPIEPHFSGHQSGIADVACWISTPSHARGWYKDQAPMLFSMWEATKLPPSFRENMHNFERLIVPSEQNLELFSEYHPDVRYVPLGVDPLRWHFRERQQPENQFRFLIGGSGKRKGTDLARRAYRLAFPKWETMSPTPVLVMKSPRGVENYGPGIEVVSGKISNEEEVELYASAHCYLQPSRGEGFGLQPLQAIAQGLPTILTNAHGHASFAHLGLPIGYTMTKSDYFIYGDAGDWWEPSLEELVAWMRYVYENYSWACDKAEYGAAEVASNFTWAHTADKFLDAIGRDRLGSYSGSAEWVEPDLARFRVMVNTPWTADIGGTSYQFLPGQEYWEPADVKRILFEAGLLNPACLEGEGGADLGLVQAQLEMVGAYTAAHAFCDTCGQRLGSGVTKADEIYADLEAAACP